MLVPGELASLGFGKVATSQCIRKEAIVTLYLAPMYGQL
jgi:hypothetical protein